MKWVRELGTSGVSTSAIALGLAALGRPGYINIGRNGDFASRSVDALADRTHKVLDAALHAGVRHIDVARSYGRAEEFLSSWLRTRSIEPGALTVSSKWGYTYTADWRIDPFIAFGQVFRSLGEAFSRPQVAAGVGFRAWVRPNVLGRVDVANGGEGWKVYVEIGYPY